MHLSENSLLKILVAGRNARESWVNDIHQDRSQSEFHTLFDKVCFQPTKFYECNRMSLNTYQCILNAIEEAMKKQSNFRDISPSERLTVAFRYDFSNFLVFFIFVLYLFVHFYCINF
jgi:hypothetical protein